ncbi:pantothenate kinase [Pseudomonas sp. RIT-PI-AD]|uniref:pantothenate kinase n=1 Tax=Pseudomonas sp. RIT-PI-AD TaxID=3035294 RepID=UPI0021D9E601|nr:pantothenate kinase [Pseudomonas sp. RIT-PI-AD]
MILELDCGNSLIKWRAIEAVDGSVHMEGIAGSEDELFHALSSTRELRIRHCRLVSVRSDEEATQLVARLKERFGVDAILACPAKVQAGVTNGYEEYQKLGLDRWLAILGGYHLAKRACLVLDLGTAVTSDLVNAQGEHLGGFICPGILMMRNQLRTHTRRIRYDDRAAERAQQALSPGRSTVEAVERGCLLMLRGFVTTQVESAKQMFGGEFDIFLTGGDAVLAKEILPQAKVLPDLVFTGLAIACPLP